jgi:hypothetical protein
LYFSPADLANPLLEATLWGDEANPDNDELTNAEEFLFQGNPLVASPDLLPRGTLVRVGGAWHVSYSYHAPVDPEDCVFAVQRSQDLIDWDNLPANTVQETERDDYPLEGTTRITVQLMNAVPEEVAERYYRGVLVTPGATVN